ncbi:tetratricopeptide repeat protein [Granulicella sibirica]|nr:tetratricopeptide repeat protein [Granulicella sibirica]
MSALLGLKCTTHEADKKRRCVILPLLVLAFAIPMRSALLVGQAPTAILLTGKVVGLDGKPAAGAEVKLREQATDDVTVTTDASGSFELKSPPQTRYVLSADTVDHRHGELAVAELAVAEPREGLRIVVKTGAGAQAAMDFADKPNFTVAGITDWTAVGGHGSDATLRTSEEIARQTAALKNSAPERGPGSKREEGAKEVALREAVTAQPESYAANRALGDFYLQATRYAEASGFLETASRLHGGSAPDEYNAALACRGEGDFARARQHVMRALEKEDRAAYHALAGDLDERLGDPLAAAREDERATALEPSEANYFAWGSELLVHRAIWQAVEVFSRGAQLHPESQRLKMGQGAALFGGARYDEAAERLCEASDLDPANRETYVFLGKVGLASPSPAACVGKKLKRFVSMRPEDADANYYEAMILIKGREPGEQGRAADLLRKAVALNPQFAEGYLQLGILALARRDNAGAQAEFERAIKADASLAEAHYRLGVLYDRAGNSERARVEFARHEELVKDKAEAVERERREVKQFLVTSGDTHTK